MSRADLASLEKYLPTDEHRAEFREMLAYAEKLPDTDEILKVIRSMGLFSSIAHSIPEQISGSIAAAMQQQKVALDAHAEQLKREINELRKELLQTREAPRLVAEAVNKLHIATEGIERAATELVQHSRERIKEFVFGRMALAFMAGVVVLICLVKYIVPYIAHLFGCEYRF